MLKIVKFNYWQQCNGKYLFNGHKSHDIYRTLSHSPLLIVAFTPLISIQVKRYL